MTSVQFPTLHVTDANESMKRIVPDHLLMLGRHANGCSSSLGAIGGQPSSWPFSFEITGTTGRLELLGGHQYGYQAGAFPLELNGQPDPTPEQTVSSLTGPPLNLSELYTQLARDIREDTRTVQDFAHAARMTRLLDAINQAVTTGTRKSSIDWPS